MPSEWTTIGAEKKRSCVCGYTEKKDIHDVFGNNDLVIGMKSDNVRCMKEALYSWALATHRTENYEYLFIDEDGQYFGALTRECIIEFQGCNGCTIDGLVGDETKTALLQYYNP